jgi:hypothetical protein
MTVRRRTALRSVLALLGLAFFFVPGFAYLAGERAEPIENRPLAKFPALSSGFEVFDGITIWSVDHLPLRDSAVRFYGRVSRSLLGEVAVIGQVSAPVGIGQSGALAGRTPRAPEPISGTSVVIGRDGWLYLDQEFELACHPGLSVGDALASARRLSEIVSRSGRRLVIGVAPDKSSVVPQFVPDEYALKGCAERARAGRLAALRASSLPALVDLRAALDAEQRRSGVPIYLEADTHWTDLGSTVAARSVAATVDPGLNKGTRVVRLPDRSQPEDLAFLIGDTQPRAERHYEIVRDGVAAEEVRVPGGRRSVARTGAGEARLYRPVTLLLGDSFARRSFGQFSQFFADLTFLPVDTPKRGPARLSDRVLIGQIARSRLIVLIRGERGFWSRDQRTVLSDRFLDQLERRLPSRPVPPG